MNLFKAAMNRLKAKAVEQIAEKIILGEKEKIKPVHGPCGHSLPPWREWLRDDELEYYNKMNPSIMGVYQWDKPKRRNP